MMPFELIGYTKYPNEQGEWAARTAVSILKGKRPEDIPIVKNKNARIYLNMKLAKKMKIRFPIELIENANLIEAE